MGLEEMISGFQRRQKYNRLVGRTKDQILNRFTMEQLQKFYSTYVDSSVNAGGLRPVDEISVLTLAQDFVGNPKNTRRYYTEKIGENISLAEVISYAQRIKVGIADLVQAFNDEKGRI